MLEYILKRFLFYRNLLNEIKHLYNIVYDYEQRIKEIERRYKAYDKRLDYLDTKIQDIDNFQSEVF